MSFHEAWVCVCVCEAQVNATRQRKRRGEKRVEFSNHKLTKERMSCDKWWKRVGDCDQSLVVSGREWLSFDSGMRYIVTGEITRKFNKCSFLLWVILSIIEECKVRISISINRNNFNRIDSWMFTIQLVIPWWHIFFSHWKESHIHLLIKRTQPGSLLNENPLWLFTLIEMSDSETVLKASNKKYSHQIDLNQFCYKGKESAKRNNNNYMSSTMIKHHRIGKNS